MNFKRLLKNAAFCSTIQQSGHEHQNDTSVLTPQEDLIPVIVYKSR